jgi:hypothetical protein
VDVKSIGAIATVVGAAIGFAGAVVGQHFATERAIFLERLDNINALRAETYVEFFSAMAKLEQSRQFGYESYNAFLGNKPEDDRLSERLENALWVYHEAAKEARMKLAAFAPTELVNALADYYRERYSPRECDVTWKRDALTYLAMRRELLDGIEENDVEPEQLFLLMWNCDPRKINGARDTAVPDKER